MKEHEFWPRYRRVMDLVWCNPRNDQRPAVRRFLRKFELPTQTVVDIGPGDAYYLEDLKPATYAVVEPNPEFQQLLNQKAASLRIRITTYESVGDFLAADALASASLVLMVHVLLYLELSEAEAILSRIRSVPLIIVHPSPQSATTSQLARLCGHSTDDSAVRLKERLMARPTARESAATHLIIPADTSINDIAFLIAHRMLGPDAEDGPILAKAEEFAETHLESWRDDGMISIPQPQIMEAYNLAEVRQGAFSSLTS